MSRRLRLLPLAAALTCCLAAVASCGPNQKSGSGAADHFTVVTIEWPGASASEVEQQIAAPLEQALASLDGLATLESASRTGGCALNLQFRSDQDRRDASAKLADAIARALKRMPPDANPPKISRLPADALPGIWLTLAGDDRPEAELATLAERVRERLTRLAGIEEVRIYGALRPELQVQLDADRLAAYGLALSECAQAIRRAAERTGNPPAEGERPLAPSGDDLPEVVLAMRDGAPVRVRDVADVRRGTATPDSFVLQAGESAIALGVFVLGESADEVARRIRASLPDIAATLPDGVSLSLALDTKDARAAGEPGTLVEFVAPAGVERAQMRELAARVEQDLRTHAADGMLALWTAGDPHVVRLLAPPRAGDAGDRLIAAARELAIPGVLVRGQALSKLRTAWRPRQPLELALTGPDRDLLQKWANALADRLKAVPGLLDVVAESPSAASSLAIVPDREKLAQHGITALSVAELCAAASDGLAISRAQAEALDIRLYLGERPRGPDDLKSLRIHTEGALIPLGQVAEVRVDAAPAALHRRNQRPALSVTAAPAATATAEARETMLRLASELRAELRLSSEYRAECR